MACEKTYNPLEPVAVTMTVAEWESVLHWLDYGRCYHDAKKWECLCNIKDKAIAGRQATEHEKAGAEAERIYKIINATLYQAPQPETE